MDLQPPGKLIVTAETELGANCIALSADGARDTVDVVVTADAVTIDAAPTLLRAGQTGLVETRIITFPDSLDVVRTMTPFDLSDVIFASDDSDVAAIDATGFVTTETAGSALLTVTWVPDSTGIVALAGTGTSRSASTALEVVANVPDSAFLDVGSTFGAFAVPDSANGEVIVVDQFGNVNRNPAEILDIFAESDAPATATVVAEIQQTTDPVTGEVSARAVMEVQIVGTGIANISGTVTTSTGVFAWGPASVIGADPQVTSLTPDNGTFAEFTTIDGSGFVPGFTTVFVKRVDSGVDYILGNFTVDNDTQITAQMPTWTVPGSFEITVSVGGVLSGAATWTQTVGFDEATTEDNSFWNTGGQADISVPAFVRGTQVGEPVDGLLGTQADWFFFDISGGTRTIDITATPIIDTNDMELYVIDGGFNFFWCHFDNTGAPSPDGGECELPGAGEELDPGIFSTGNWWVIPIEFFGADPVEYDLEISVVGD
jgi:hypothetical protein